MGADEIDNKEEWRPMTGVKHTRYSDYTDVENFPPLFSNLPLRVVPNSKIMAGNPCLPITY